MHVTKLLNRVVFATTESGHARPGRAAVTRPACYHHDRFVTVAINKKATCIKTLFHAKVNRSSASRLMNGFHGTLRAVRSSGARGAPEAMGCTMGASRPHRSQGAHEARTWRAHKEADAPFTISMPGRSSRKRDVRPLHEGIHGVNPSPAKSTEIAARRGASDLRPRKRRAKLGSSASAGRQAPRSP